MSSAKRYDLSARIDGRIRRVLGIGAVFTSPQRRGRAARAGCSSALLESAVAEGYEFALLFSEIAPAFYERLDFVPVPLREIANPCDRKGGSPMVLVRAGDDRDIPAIAEMSATRAVNARFALDRSEDWIRYRHHEASTVVGSRPGRSARDGVPGDGGRPPGGRLHRHDR